MPATLYVLEDVNLICGDTGSETTPGHSTHLSLQEWKLPGWEENYVDHVAGGAPVGIEINTHIQKFESTFTLAGWQPEIMTMLGRSERAYQRFTGYGMIRDRRTGEQLQAIAIMEGRLGRVNPTNWRKGDLQHHEYSVRGIVHYELLMQEVPESEPRQIYFWDFFTSTLVVGEFDINAERQRILAIPGVAI
jgi:phage tail tube protein FII